jgi:hypothetical protein
MPNPGPADPPELADIGRLLNRATRAARTEDQPLRRLLLDHLSPEAATLPTVSATWASYEHVNVRGRVFRYWTWAADAERGTLTCRYSLDGRESAERVTLAPGPRLRH